jgi:hypothetical protein
MPTAEEFKKFNRPLIEEFRANKGGSGYLLTDRTPNRVVVVEIELQHCFVEKV